MIRFVSPANPSAHVTLVRDDPASGQPQLPIEVDAVDRVHALAVEPGLGIVYPLTDEPWGVRRFFGTDPNGVILNILSHQARPGSTERDAVAVAAGGFA